MAALQGQPLTEACDADVQTYCASDISPKGIGRVRACLTRIATPALVAAGAPITKARLDLRT